MSTKRSIVRKAQHVNGATPANGAQPAAIIKLVEHEALVFEIDPNDLTWEDMEELMDLYERQEKGELSAREGDAAVIALLTRITGEDIRKLPARVVRSLLEQFGVVVGMEAQNAKN
jgi:hypothetical protein